MDRKNRVWLIVLIVLLIAAIVGLVLVKNQWDESESNYVRASAQLLEEQSAAEKLQTELDAARSEADTLKSNLENKTTEADALKTEAETLKADLENKTTEADALKTEA